LIVSKQMLTSWQVRSKTWCIHSYHATRYTKKYAICTIGTL